MAKFSFRKRSTEEEGAEVTAPEEEPSGRSGGMRRIFIIAGIGVILIGGGYVAQELFFAPPPPPPPRPRPAVPAPPAKAPVPAPPTKEAAPAPAGPSKPPVKEEAKPTPPGPTPPPTKGAPAGPPLPVSSAKAPAPSLPAKVAVPAPAKTGTPPPTKVQVKPSENASPTPTVKPVPTSYSLQVGAMAMEENAEALKQKLAAAGFPAVIRKATALIGKQTVTVGDPMGRREAEELARRLNVDGLPSQLADVGGKFTPQIGAFFNLDEAIDLARELQKKNYRPKITSKPAKTLVYQVRHGKFDSRATAVRRGEELKGKGFTDVMVVGE